jgi:hypothetical protein
MTCRMCQAGDAQLYRLPVDKQLGSVPLLSACFFCYLRLTGNRPPPTEVVTRWEEDARLR